MLHLYVKPQLEKLFVWFSMPCKVMKCPICIFQSLKRICDFFRRLKSDNAKMKKNKKAAEDSQDAVKKGIWFVSCGFL